MSYSFVQLYLIKCVVCMLNYMFDQTKKIFDHFIYIWKWFLSLFVFMFSAYFVSHCFKHVLCWKIGVKIFGYSHESQVLATGLATHSRVASFQGFSHEFTQNGSQITRNSPIAKTPKISFLKGFSRETCFKLLPSSLKPLFQ